MILALFLQVGLSSFQAQVQEASSKLSLPLPQVQLTPVSYDKARRLAWAPICQSPPACPPATIVIATDVAATAPAPVLRYLAYHETCHLRLGHTGWWSTFDDDSTAHLQVRTCMMKALGPEFWNLLWHRNLYGKQFLRPVRRQRFGSEALR